MGNFLKKNWFVALLAVIFAGISCFYIYDTNKGKLKGKKADGQDVVYSVAGQDVTASEFYGELYDQGGITALANIVAQQTAEQTVTATDEMKEQAKTQAENLVASYQNYYGSTYREALDQAMKSVGYTGHEDVEKYMLNMLKQQQLTKDYAMNNFDDLKIRSISYLLIQFDDVPHTMEEATDAEKARIKAVDDAFKAGEDFRTIAANNSQDTSTAPKGGLLGTVDKNTTGLDAAFLEAALALNEGEVSDWVYSNSFGWFRIKCNASTKDSLQTFADEQALYEARAAAEKAAAAAAGEGKEPEPVNDEDLTVTPIDPLNSLVATYDQTLTSKAVFEKAQELGITYHDDELLEGQLKAVFGLTEDQEG